MGQTLSEFLTELDLHEDRVPLDLLVDRLRDLEIDIDMVQEYARFGETRYRRNLMHAGNGFHALILCWRNGQRSPIHDHTGSSCGVRVLQGTVTETIFDRAPNGMVVPRSSSTLAEGEVCGSEDADIHQVSNLQSGGRDLVTLHVYSPPLITMNTYSLHSAEVRQFTDPISEFAAGAGI